MRVKSWVSIVEIARHLGLHDVHAEIVCRWLQAKSDPATELGYRKKE
jgi:hypothetical protein